MSLPDRETLLRRFTAWLDQALAAEEPPKGIPEEILANSDDAAEHDLYSVQAALTALAQEIKLQGRSFKQLSEAIEPVADMAPALSSLMDESRRQARREVLDSLLDLRDHLAHGEQAASQTAAALQSRRWLSWRRHDNASGVVAALHTGYRLTAARLDEILDSFDLHAIDCLGAQFDARRMDAIGLEETTRVAEGSVVEVCRRGYEWNGEVYRPAQVRVARRPGGDRNGES